MSYELWVVFQFKQVFERITSWSYSYDKVEGELGGRGELREEGLGGQQEGCREGEKQQSWVNVGGQPCQQLIS